MKDIVIEPKKHGARKSQKEWSEINALWEKNPKRLKVFCAELGISYTSFAYWRGRLKKERQPEKATSFAIAKTQMPEVLPLKGRLSTLKIYYPNGITLSLCCKLTSPTVSMIQRLLKVPPCR